MLNEIFFLRNKRPKTLTKFVLVNPLGSTSNVNISGTERDRYLRFLPKDLYLIINPHYYLS